MFTEVVRVEGFVCFNRFRTGEEERKVLNIEWGRHESLEPWDVGPLSDWIDARVKEARAARLPAPPSTTAGNTL